MHQEKLMNHAIEVRKKAKPKGEDICKNEALQGRWLRT